MRGTGPRATDREGFDCEGQALALRAGKVASLIFSYLLVQFPCNVGRGPVLRYAVVKVSLTACEGQALALRIGKVLIARDRPSRYG